MADHTHSPLVRAIAWFLLTFLYWGIVSLPVVTMLIVFPPLGIAFAIGAVLGFRRLVRRVREEAA